jgi:hypothetical protein
MGSRSTSPPVREAAPASRPDSGRDMADDSTKEEFMSRTSISAFVADGLPSWKFFSLYAGGFKCLSIG